MQLYAQRQVASTFGRWTSEMIKGNLTGWINRFHAQKQYVNTLIYVLMQANSKVHTKHLCLYMWRFGLRYKKSPWNRVP